MDGLIAAVQPFAWPAVFIVLMFLMHGLHGGHGAHSGHDPKQGPAGPAEQDDAAARGGHRHD